MGLEPGKRTVLVAAHQARVANDIRRQDRCQSPYNPLVRHGAFPKAADCRASAPYPSRVTSLGTGEAVSSMFPRLGSMEFSRFGPDQRPLPAAHFLWHFCDMARDANEGRC